jgi:tetratricopeptide (TPR) repeat protein
VLRAVYARGEEDLLAAAAALERALEINLEETGSLLALGEVELLLGELDLAEERLELACRTNPRAVGGFFLRAYIAWRRGDERAARELLEKASAARGEDFKPEGGAAEGETARLMHREVTPLSRYWERWDGTTDPAAALGSLLEHLEDSVVAVRIGGCRTSRGPLSAGCSASPRFLHSAPRRSRLSPALHAL